MRWDGIDWLPRPVPLAAEGAFACGDSARALARHVLDLECEHRQHLSGVCADGLLVFLGPSSALPWCSGIRYLGRPIPGHPVYWPTERMPAHSEAMLARGIVQHAREGKLVGPYALIPEHALLVSLNEASAIDDAVLARWIEAA